MSDIPQHPFLLKRQASAETIQVNLHSSGMMEQQLREWSHNPRDSIESSYITNRQQAIMTLLKEESASSNELQERVCVEFRLREFAEITCQKWDSAYTELLKELSARDAEVQQLKDTLTNLRKSLYTVGRLPSNRLCVF
jgi:hypothetical protein